MKRISEMQQLVIVFSSAMRTSEFYSKYDNKLLPIKTPGLKVTCKGKQKLDSKLNKASSFLWKHFNTQLYTVNNKKAKSRKIHHKTILFSF